MAKVVFKSYNPNDNLLLPPCLGDSSGLNVPPVSLSNVPGTAESIVPLIAETNVPGVSL